MLDVVTIKNDFPILERTIRGNKKLIYLDSGATSQKPRQVIESEQEFIFKHNAATHRGAHQLAEEATNAYEHAREITADFVGARSQEIVFTKSSTESLNLLAYSLSDPRAGDLYIGAGDEILISEAEHHANLVPWQELCERTGATLRWFPLHDDGRIDLDATCVTSATKLISITHVSNVTGAITDIARVVELAHSVGALVIVDACQSVPHMPVNFAELGVDFAAFSGHKMLAPSGIGVLYGKLNRLSALPPFLTGGSMIEHVSMEKSSFLAPPQRFEAGVPNMSQAIGLGAAIRYLNSLGMDQVEQHERILTEYALSELALLKGVRIIGPTDMSNRGGAVSFVVDGIHAHDVGQFLDDSGVEIRVGHHCAEPLHTRFGVASTTRATFYIYNDKSDVEALIEGVKRVQQFFGVA